MSIYKKNLMVGATLVLGLVLLAAMIIRFGNAPAQLLAKPHFKVTFMAERADGLSNGSPVTYCGMRVGQVSSVELAPDRQSVRILANIDEQPPLPANVQGVIYSQVLGNVSYMTLQLTPATPTTASSTPPGRLAPQGTLGGNAMLKAEFRGIDLLPPEFARAADELRRLSEEFRNTKILTHLDEAVVATREQIVKIGKATDSIQSLAVNVDSLVSDPRMRQDIKEAVRNFRETTESAHEVAQNLNRLTQTATTQMTQVGTQATALLADTQKRIDEISQQMGDRLLQVSKALDNVESVTRKLNEGKGSAGMLINDPKLYESLLDSSRTLNLTIKDVQRLVEQWEKEGVYLKLSK